MADSQTSTPRSGGTATGDPAVREARQARARIDRLWHRAEQAAHGLPPLVARARRLTQTMTRGSHGRRRAGSGDAFWQFRPYHAGDAAMAIDWRRSARSDNLYVRQKENEIAQTVWLWCDSSPSMAFGSDPAHDSKADRAVLLALAAALMLVEGGERVALLGHHGRAAGGRFGLNRLREALAMAEPDAAGGFPDPGPLPRHARLLLIGDFLDDEAVLKAGLDRLVARGIGGHMLHVVDPAEEDFPYRGRVRLEGLEQDGGVLLGRAEDLRHAYQGRMAAWRQTLGRLAVGAGWTFNSHRTDRPPHTALMTLMVAVGELDPDRC